MTEPWLVISYKVNASTSSITLERDGKRRRLTLIQFIDRVNSEGGLTRLPAGGKRPSAGRTWNHDPVPA